MASTTFVNGTVVTSDWLNAVNQQVFAISNANALRSLDKTIYSRVRTLGYTTPGDLGSGNYYYDSTDTTSADNGGTIFVAADGGRWKLIHHGRVSVKQWGLGDNIANDIVGIQAMFIASRTQGFEIFIPAGVKCFIQFSSGTPQLFIDGSVKITGGDRLTCGFRINVNYNMLNHAPLFCFGITSVGSAVNKVYGSINNIGWFVTAGCGRFERMCHVYGAHDFDVTHCYADFTAVTWTVNQQAGGWWASNVQPTFAVGQTQDTNITLRDNIGYSSAEYQNAESFGFTNVTGLHYLNNTLIGWSDDMAAHGCTDVTMSGNHLETVSGRYYVENSQFVKIIDNYIKPLPRPISGGYLGSTRSFIGVNMTTQYVVTTTDVPNYDITIRGNSIYLPAGSYCNPGIVCYGVQDGLTITDNSIYNDGNGGGATSPTTSILVSTLYRTGWTGPAGNPDFAAGGAIRLRNAEIRDNKMIGSGWLDNEGTISTAVYAGGAAADIIGEVEVEGNAAGAYSILNEQVTFRKNFGIATSTDPLKSASLVSVWNDLPVASSWVGLFPASANINNTNFPQGTPTFYTTLDSDGMKFIAQRAGRVIGAYSQFTAALVSANNVVLRILKNGVQIGSDTDSSSNSPTTNPSRYLWNFQGVAGMTFVEGDKLEALVTIRVAQGATIIVGRLTLVTMYL